MSLKDLITSLEILSKYMIDELESKKSVYPVEGIIYVFINTPIDKNDDYYKLVNSEWANVDTFCWMIEL